MKISEKQFEGKSFTFTIPYLGDIMARGEDPNGKKKFRLAGKEGLKITCNGIDISHEVYIDADLTIKAMDARYYHEVEKFYFANVTNMTLDSNDSIKVTGFFEQSEIDYLNGSTGAPAWAASGSVGVYTFYVQGGHHYHHGYGGSGSFGGELGRFYIEVYQGGALIDTFDSYSHQTGGYAFGSGPWGPIEVADNDNQITLRLIQHANSTWGNNNWAYAGIAVLQDDQSTLIAEYAYGTNWGAPWAASATALTTQAASTPLDVVITLPF